jgi:GNAT superfamily N-acetyltransferase
MDVQRLHAGNLPNFFKMPQSEDFAVAFFEEMLADPKNSLFLAEESGQALGYVFCKLMERPETPFTFALRYLLVDQISVRPTVQGKGVGAALIERAVTLARELNVPKSGWIRGDSILAHTRSLKRWDLKNSTIDCDEIWSE